MGGAFHHEATEDELAAAKPASAKAKAKTSAKSKAKPASATNSPAPKLAEKHPRSPGQGSPNPVATKRVKGKQPEADQAKVIEELRKVSMGTSVHVQCVPDMCGFNALVDLHVLVPTKKLYTPYCIPFIWYLPGRRMQR